MKKYLVLLPALMLMQCFLPIDVSAIPAFARKYGFNCNMCHSSYPKLNDFGQRFRDSGYQIPGQEGKEKTVFDTPPPLAMRTSFGYSAYNTDAGTTSSFSISGFDMLAAGVLHKNISFLLIYKPQYDLTTPGFVESNGGDASQQGTLESANIVFSNICPDVLNVRVGRLEPSAHLISSKRTFYLFQPYEVYSFATPRNGAIFENNQLGIEASGHMQSGLKYTVGIANGTSGPDNNNAKDVYATISKTFGKGEGQSAGQRIGFFGYYGWQPLDLTGKLVGPGGEADGKDNKTFYRAGANASLNWEALNVQMMYLTGTDDKTLNALKADEAYTYSGGFAQCDYAGLFDDRLVASVLVNWISPPSYDAEREMMAYSVLLRYYLGDWSAINLAFHLEYSYRTTGKETKFKENLLGLALDVAF